MPQETFVVPAISCKHCVSAIESELVDVEGVTSVKASEETKNVVVEWDAPASVEIIRDTLSEINYPAE